MEQRVTPYLLYEDGAAAIEFLTKAFGFGEDADRDCPTACTPSRGRAGRRPDRPGASRSAGPRDPSVADKTSFAYLVVDDVYGHHRRAKDAGARIIQEPSDQDYGYRHYGCVDPQGHEWYFAQPIAEASSA